MENAADAIKMGFGLLVFVIAITLTFSVIGQARATSDVILKLNDRTELYEYTSEADYNVSEKRTVGFETLLPTIHRYAKEQYAVTIFKSDGTPIVRYDLYTEGFMGNWNTILKTMDYNENSKTQYEQVRDRLTQIQSVVNRYLEETGKGNPNIDIMNYIGTQTTNITYGNSLLYYGKTGSQKDGVTVVAPWMGNPNEDTIDRIKVDMTDGTYTKSDITYYGKNLTQYKNKKFTEMFIELSTSGQTITDGTDSIETIKGNKKLEIIYIMQD